MQSLFLTVHIPDNTPLSVGLLLHAVRLCSTTAANFFFCSVLTNSILWLLVGLCLMKLTWRGAVAPPELPAVVDSTPSCCWRLLSLPDSDIEYCHLQQHRRASEDQTNTANRPHKVSKLHSAMVNILSLGLGATVNTRTCRSILVTRTYRGGGRIPPPLTFLFGNGSASVMYRCVHRDEPSRSVYRNSHFRSRDWAIIGKTI